MRVELRCDDELLRVALEDVIKSAALAATTNWTEKLVIEWVVVAPESPATRGCLTRREHEVLRLIAQGVNPRDVAQTLGIKLTTCRDHLRSIRAKLDCQSTLQAVVIAQNQGLLGA